DLTVRDGLVDPWRRDDRTVEDDREVIIDMVARVVREQLRSGLRTVVLELERDRQAARLVLTDGRGLELVAAEQRRVLLQVEDLAFGRGRLTERDEVEDAGLADEPSDRVDVGDAGQLDDDAIITLDDDDGLGHASRVHPSLDDVLQDAECLAGRRDTILGERLVLDPQPALEVEAELGLDRPPGAVRRGRIGDPQVGEEDHDQREDADQGDEEGAGSAHRRDATRKAPLTRSEASVERRTGRSSGVPLAYASRVALIRSASARLMPGTAAICSTGASRTRLI